MTEIPDYAQDGFTPPTEDREVREKLADRIAGIPMVPVEFAVGGHGTILRIEGFAGCYTNIDEAERDLIVSSLRQPAGVSEEVDTLLARIADNWETNWAGDLARHEVINHVQAVVKKARALLNRPQTVGVSEEIEQARIALRQFADPANWHLTAGCQQWMGKRDAISFAESVLALLNRSQTSETSK